MPRRPTRKAVNQQFLPQSAQSKKTRERSATKAMNQLDDGLFLETCGNPHPLGNGLFLVTYCNLHSLRTI